MCAIVDANVSGEVFGLNRPPAGKRFFDWINTGKGRLVVGGRLSKELSGVGRFSEWAREAMLAERLRVVDEEKVSGATENLQSRGACRSDDEHVVALAQVSGARLLYSNDGELQEDFKDPQLISNPRGKVYSTRKSKDISPAHEALLSRTDLCRAK